MSRVARILYELIGQLASSAAGPLNQSHAQEWLGELWVAISKGPDDVELRDRVQLLERKAGMDGPRHDPSCLGCAGGSVHHTCGQDPDANVVIVLTEAQFEEAIRKVVRAEVGRMLQAGELVRGPGR